MDGQFGMARELDKQIAELERASDSQAAREEIERLRHQLEALRRQASGRMSDAWARTRTPKMVKRWTDPLISQPSGLLVEPPSR